MWHYFGPPAVFKTMSPDEQDNMRVKLYAITGEHKIPTTKDMMDEEMCFLDLTLRKKVRSKFPGACAIEFQNIMDIVTKVLIGWDKQKAEGSNGVYGIPLAYGAGVEEQARKSLHAHFCVWIKYFNLWCDLLFDDDRERQILARTELTKIFSNDCISYTRRH